MSNSVVERIRPAIWTDTWRSCVFTPLPAAEVARLRQESKRDQLLMPDLRVLPNVFCKYPAVQAVYVFGTVATGKVRKDSDLDLAIWPRSRAAHDSLLDLMGDLVWHGFDHVDVVFLDTQNLVLKFEAVRLNRLIYCTPDFERGTVFSKIVREYWDFQPYLKVERAAYKRRVLHGTA